MSKFNFNEILLSAKANISKVMENFTKVENNALASSDIVDNLTTDDATKVLSAKQGKKLNDNFNNYSPKNNFSILSFDVSRNIPTGQIIEGDLPSGFTPVNCAVISVGAYLDSSCKYYYQSSGDSQYYPIAKHTLYHKASSNKDVIELKIGYLSDIIEGWGYDADTSKTLKIKVVLMKIS